MKQGAPWQGKEHLIQEVRLTAEGRWLHAGVEVTHVRTRQALDRGIEPWEGEGPWRWVVRVGGRIHPIVVDATPWLARAAQVVGEGTEERLRLRLLDGEMVEPRLDTLWADEGEVLWARLSDGRRARLLRSAQGDLVDRIVLDSQGRTALRIAGRDHPIADADHGTPID